MESLVELVFHVKQRAGGVAEGRWDDRQCRVPCHDG
jgi:hypothetical protein